MSERIPPEPADPVERADARRRDQRGGDVTVESDGTVKQRPHGNMDSTLVPKGKEHPERGPYEAEHDEKVPDVSADVEPRGKGDLSA
ncbi:hypothetical protein WCQ02_36055 [Paraburkholderia tropica]|uniref:MARCKS-like protein n=1 Tax=Paraburkholderia tropica TaxID=92647 RepID=A0ABX5MH11_9BURK|nr:hypothetical protein [Paraburkholderia tropica]PXX07040.1 hypothetical protein C7400_13219 [Paraburkholderia tropica]PZW72477.1 hypothetical protein C7399_13219 [Paraburkholderia tropica]